jgi:hypothetical protein
MIKVDSGGKSITPLGMPCREMRTRSEVLILPSALWCNAPKLDRFFGRLRAGTLVTTGGGCVLGRPPLLCTYFFFDRFFFQILGKSGASLASLFRVCPDSHGQSSPASGRQAGSERGLCSAEPFGGGLELSPCIADLLSRRGFRAFLRRPTR